MIPKLLVNNNQKEIQKYIDLLIEKFAISPFDVLTLGLGNSSIKIEQIRDLKQKINLKNFSGKHKVLIIYNAENLTKESQNAILKTLEEPPENTIILLCTTNENLLLSTIISRCEIIRIRDSRGLKSTDLRNPFSGNPAGLIRENQSAKSANDKKQNTQTTLSKITLMDIGEKFALAERLTAKIDKEEKLDAIRKRVEKWLDDLILEIHSFIVVNGRDRSLPKMVKSALLAKRQIKQNLNIRLVLENFLLGLFNK